MTSATILPSIGPPPPEFRRPIVPEELRPKLVSDRETPPARENPPARARSQVDPNNAGDALLARATKGDTSDQAIGTDVQSAQQKGPARPTANPFSNQLGGASAVQLQVQEATPSETSEKISEQKLQGDLSDEDKAAVANLEDRDREVRTHEQAHASTGGGYTGAPQYEYVRGPNGVQYAVGGHVDIDVAPVPNDPEATIAKMEVVRRAALAPARPSGQDRAVAATAEGHIREAQAELNKARQEAFQAQSSSGQSSSAQPSAGQSSSGGENTEGNQPGGFADALAPSLLGGENTTSQTPLTGINLLV